jgi:glycosyltransferase involved in cell wall biosynthesis
MQRIIIISAEYPPYTWGGISIATKLFAEVLSLNYSLIVIYPGNESFEKTNLKIIGLGFQSELSSNIIYKDKSEPYLNDINNKIYNSIESIINQNDIIIINNEEFVFLSSSLIKHNRVKKLIYFCHGLQNEENPNLKVINSIQSRMFELADVIIAFSEDQTAKVANLKLKAPVFTMYFPIERYSIPITKFKHLPPIFRIYATGRAVSQKGFDLLINAIKDLPKKYPIKLFLNSNHGNLQYISQLLEMIGTSNKIIFNQKWLPWDEHITTVQSSHCVIMPSRFEPFGLVCIESILCQTPIITSNVGGLSEITKGLDSCLSFKITSDYQESLENLKKSILFLYHNYNEVYDSTSYSRRKLLDRFSTGRFLNSIAKIL